MTLKITPKSKTRRRGRKVNLDYQNFQDNRALDAMRGMLSTDGLFAASSESLGLAIGVSQPTASRIIKRLIDRNKVWVIERATEQHGNVRQSRLDALGHPVTNKIFPWRGHPYSLLNTGQPRTNAGDSETATPENGSPYSFMNVSTDSSSTDGQRSVSIGCNQAGVVVPYSFVNTVPPKQAVERQLEQARLRLISLQGQQARRKRTKGVTLDSTPVQNADIEIANLRGYVGELEAWSKGGVR